jgi:prepilin-type N-terminal cleavage/methylation domain-containing protein
MSIRTQIRRHNGFSLVELLIVIAIVAIIGGIAAFSWQRYVNNANLRTAAREIVSDIEQYRAKAISENRIYIIKFFPDSNSYYIIYADPTATHPLVFITKMMSDFGSGIRLTNANYIDSLDSNWIMFEPRGTVTAGMTTLTNSRASTATITSNITGKSVVQFAMQ